MLNYITHCNDLDWTLFKEAPYFGFIHVYIEPPPPQRGCASDSLGVKLVVCFKIKPKDCFNLSLKYQFLNASLHSKFVTLDITH